MALYGLKEWYTGYIVCKCGKDSAGNIVDKYLAKYHNKVYTWTRNPLYSKAMTLKTAQKHVRALLDFADTDKSIC